MKCEKDGGADRPVNAPAAELSAVRTVTRNILQNNNDTKMQL